jgi:hypothetical protein
MLEIGWINSSFNLIQKRCLGFASVWLSWPLRKKNKNMKYEEIFNKVNGGDVISLFQYSVENILAKNPKYVSFCNEKVKLRKELEKEYKPMFKGPQSFRVYIAHLVYSLINNNKFDIERYRRFGDESERVKQETSHKIKDFFSNYSSLEKELLSFIWSDDNYINNGFSKIGLKEFYIKGILKDLFQLKNGQVGLTLFFRLSEKSKSIFIDQVVDDWGESIGNFQDVEIYDGNKLLFSSITHEDMYSFYDR